MAVTAKPLFQAQYITTSVATYYTCPASTKTIIDKLTASSNSGTPTITVYIVPNGNSANDQYRMLVAKTLTTPGTNGDDLTIMQNQILEAGDTIQIVGSANTTIVIRGSGREVTT